MPKNPYPEDILEKIKKKFGHYLAEDETMKLFCGLSNTYLFQKASQYFIFALLILIPLSLPAFYFLKTDFIILTSAVFFLAVFFSLVKVYFLKEGIQYILTNKRLIIQIGYFSVTLSSTPYSKITYIEVDQSFSERMFFKFGKVTIHTAGTNAKPIILEYLDTPFEFKNELEKLIHIDKRLLRNF